MPEALKSSSEAVMRPGSEFAEQQPEPTTKWKHAKGTLPWQTPAMIVAGLGVFATAIAMGSHFSDLEIPSVTYEVDTESVPAAPEPDVKKPVTTVGTPAKVVDPQESIQGPNGSEETPNVRPETQAPKATFVTDDTYQAGKQTMVHNGYSDELLRKEPTDDDIWNLEGTADARGVELSNEEAAEALKNGGFVKGGVTYEIWQKDTGEFQLVRCDADHELVGNVPNFDSHPVTHEPRDYNAESDKLTTPAHEESVEEPVQRGPSGVWFNGQWVTEETQYHGEHEACVQESYDPREVAEVQYLLNRYFPGITDPNFFLHPNPFYGYGGSYGQYMAYEEVQQFILRHR